MNVGTIDNLDELLIMMDENELKNKLWRMSDEIYHQCDTALGSTGLRKYEDSPADYFESRHTHFKPTTEMKIGTALHALLLEGEEYFKSQVGKYPAGNKNTKVYKAALEEMKEGGLIRPVMLDKSDYDSVVEMTGTVYNKNTVRGLLSGGEAELSAFTPIPDTQIWTKARVDYLNVTDSYMVDLKSTSCNSLSHFMTSVFTWNYEVQLAYYKTVIYWATGIEIEGLYILGVQKKKPHKIFPVRIKDLEFDLGVEQMTSYLDQHVQCSQSNSFPSNDDEIVVATAPDWKLRKWGLI